MSGRPTTYVPDDSIRERVRSLAAAGATWELIAARIGWTEKVARRKLSADYQRGIDEANTVIAGELFKKAKAGNMTAIIFWLKTRARWREVHPIEDEDDDGKIETFQIKVVRAPGPAKT